MSPVDSCIAFAGNANALAIARTRFYAHLQRLCALDCAFAVAYGAWRLHFAGTAAARAGNVKLHAAAGLRDMPAAVALRARRRRSHNAAAVAVGTSIKPRDVQAHHCAADCFPEADVDLVFKIGAMFRPHFRGCAAAPTAKDAGKNIAEATAAT